MLAQQLLALCCWLAQPAAAPPAGRPPWAIYWDMHDAVNDSYDRSKARPHTPPSPTIRPAAARGSPSHLLCD